MDNLDASSAAGVTAKFPVRRRCPFGPPPEYAELRETIPVADVELFDGRIATLLTRAEDVKALYASSDVSSARTHPDFPRYRPTPPLMRDASTSLVALDDPEHGIYRRMLNKEFTHKRVQAMRPRIQEIVDQAVDNLKACARPADFVENVAISIPSLVICELLGIPYEDHEYFQAETERMHRSQEPEVAAAAFERMYAYMEDLVDRKASADADDGLISRLHARVRAGELSRDRLVGFAFLMLIAGHETTSNMISLGTLTFMLDREKADYALHDGHMTGVVEELLRYFSPVDSQGARLVVRDTEIGGRTFKAGEGVIGSAFAGNFDPEAFEDPLRLDLTRRPKNHLTFGYGKHSCLGQSLARAELEMAYRTILTRLPDLKLAVPLDEVPFKYDGLAFGIYEMPVSW